MNVYTYYEDIGNKRPEGLLNLWAESWQKRGWTPIILGRKEAEASLLFHDVYKAAQLLPTVNHIKFETVNYIRYCAMDTVGGGLLVDYDCINYAFTEENLPKHLAMARLAHGGFVWMTAYGVHCFCRQLGDWIYNDKPCVVLNGQPHLSDMYMLMFLNFPVIPNICYNYNVKGWDTVKVVHYSTTSLGSFEDKEVKIQQLRPI